MMNRTEKKCAKRTKLSFCLLSILLNNFWSKIYGHLIQKIGKNIDCKIRLSETWKCGNLNSQFKSLRNFYGLEENYHSCIDSFSLSYLQLFLNFKEHVTFIVTAWWALTSKRSSTETDYGVWKLLSCSFMLWSVKTQPKHSQDCLNVST